MIIFNITCHIEQSISQKFEIFYENLITKNQFGESFFSEITLLKLLTEIDDNTHTYSIQLKFEGMPYYQQFMVEKEDHLLAQLQNEFIGKIFTFTTLLQAIK